MLTSSPIISVYYMPNIDQTVRLNESYFNVGYRAIPAAKDSTRSLPA